MSKRLSALYATSLVWLTPALAWAAEETTLRSYFQPGVNGLWVLCNVSYAGMRAQHDPDLGGWRVAAFIFGFPGTLVSYFAVKEGQCRAYGVRLPRS